MKQEPPPFNDSHQKAYSPEALAKKLLKSGQALGRSVVENALVLYYVGMDAATPLEAKLTVYACLGYLILPLDVIPDIIPVLGFTDDVAALLKALHLLREHTTESHRIKAREKVADWFGEAQSLRSQAKPDDVIDI